MEARQQGEFRLRAVPPSESVSESQGNTHAEREHNAAHPYLHGMRPTHKPVKNPTDDWEDAVEPADDLDDPSNFFVKMMDSRDSIQLSSRPRLDRTIYGEIVKIIDDRTNFPEVNNLQEFYHDAVIHRLIQHYRSDRPTSSLLRRNLGVTLQRERMEQARHYLENSEEAVAEFVKLIHDLREKGNETAAMKVCRQMWHAKGNFDPTVQPELDEILSEFGFEPGPDDVAGYEPEWEDLRDLPPSDYR